MTHSRSTLRFYYNPTMVMCARITGIFCRPFCNIFRAFRRDNRNIKPRKILVQDGYRLGDLLLLNPALSVLRQRYPEALIHLVTHPDGCSLVREWGLVDRCIPYRAPWARFPGTMKKRLRESIICLRRIRRQEYDCAVDFRGDPRGLFFLFCAAIPRILSFNDFGGGVWCTQSFRTPFSHTHQMLRSVYLVHCMTGSAPLLKTVSPRWPQIAPAGMAQESETSGYDIVIHPASSRSHRRWHDSRWAELIAYFRNCGFSPILVGASSERNLLEGIARTTTSSCAVSTPDFCELQHFISKAKLVVCVDSFIMHAAWALNRPVLALYGPSCPKNTAPLTSKARVMWNDTILSPPYTAWTGPRPVSSISVRGVIRGIEELYIGE